MKVTPKLKQILPISALGIVQRTALKNDEQLPKSCVMKIEEALLCQWFKQDP